MKLKQFLSWSAKENLRNMGIFYSIYIAILLIFMLAYMIISNALPIIGETTLSVDGATGIYLVVIGITTFGMFLRIGVANGVSRRTVFYCQVIGAFINAGVVTIMTILINFVLGQTLQLSITDMFSVFMVINGFSIASNIFIAILLMLTLNLFITCGGSFIGGLYYRMGKLTKILVSILVPSTILVGMPILIAYFPSQVLAIYTAVLDPLVQLVFASGLNMVLACAVVSAILMVLTWLLIRKAPAKMKK